MKNCDPFVSCPLFAIDTVPLALCCQGITKLDLAQKYVWKKANSVKYGEKPPKRQKK